MDLHLMKRPGAWLPMGMSIAGIALVIWYAAVNGVVHQADEGTPAHIFQLLMLAQLPVIGLFVVRWRSREPNGMIPVLLVQGVLMGVALGCVALLT